MKKCVRYPEIFIYEKYKDSEYMLYLFERVEVEARLHDIIVSFYRAKKELPLEINKFYALLAGSNQFGRLIVTALLPHNIITSNEIQAFKDRDASQSEQFELMLISIKLKSNSMLLKYITEVMPIMYGNLISYYGDEKSSFKIMSQIARPNLYDMLYT